MRCAASLARWLRRPPRWLRRGRHPKARAPPLPGPMIESGARRLRLARVLLAVGLAAAMIAAMVKVRSLAEDDQSSPTGVIAGNNGFTGSRLPDGYRAPDFELTNQDGKTVSMRGLRGGPVLVTFTYSVCEESCPAQLQLIRRAADELGREIPALAISVDPASDTRYSARRFLIEQRVLGQVDFLLGDRRKLARVWKGFGVQPQTKKLDHHARIVLIDADGFQRLGYTPYDVSAGQLAADIKRLEQGIDP